MTRSHAIPTLVLMGQTTSYCVTSRDLATFGYANLMRLKSSTRTAGRQSCEWQLPVEELDASYGELPWRISRRVLETLGEHEAERRGQYLKSGNASSIVSSLSASKSAKPEAAAPRDCAKHTATGLLVDDVHSALQVMFEDTNECSLNELMELMTDFMEFKHTRAQVQRTLRAMDSSGNSSIAYLDGRIM